MTKKSFREIVNSLVIIGAPTIMIACGDGKSSDPAPVVTYATMTVSNATKTTDNGTLTLTTSTTCTKDATSDLLTVVLSSTSGQNMSVTVKGFKSTASTYTCVQASTNQTDPVSVGSKYDTCGVSFHTLSAATGTALNGYAMYRDTVAIKPFTYAGTCSIAFTDTAPTVKGTVTCSKLLQTELDGSARNPIDTSMTADISGSFYCNL
ncbi:MAG: hypothetical protein NTV34_06875 [Proteobacteria bacterium]|nr:hypothetical protein [Pseudomonadota bacterium]